MHSSSTIASLLALFICTQAGAHGLWTEERRGNIEVVYGHGAEDSAFAAEKVKRAWAYDAAGKMIPVTLQRLADHARLQPLKPPAVVAVVLDNGPWSQTPDQRWVNQDRTQVKNAVASTHSFKYSLAIYQAGARLPKLDQLRLAIIPQSDPLKVGPGKELEVQVLVDGKPAADIELCGDYRGAPHEVSGKTDKDGRARIRVRNEGLNVISAQATLPMPKDAPVERQSLFGSLTFLGEPHHE
ncbi:DUF4198 domain-containing protein [Pseudomonas chlororaphis]|uniref:Nickel ABC transporter substrate-binding protein n=1 Tax=Pseudomonas chlororaphis TaxID=587753 RepID=A0A1Q8ESI2_9PSED|nr:DUF4198 domain-containing protein [Pseudomonas chlororaphis]OLF54752.1 nickel ABC transporter substrate-binding protein [Pseudomonas chlororaphis]